MIFPEVVDKIHTFLLQFFFGTFRFWLKNWKVPRWKTHLSIDDWKHVWVPVCYPTPGSKSGPPHWNKKALVWAVLFTGKKKKNVRSNFCFILWKLRKDQLSEHLRTRSLAKLKTRTTCKHLIPLLLKYFLFIICECLESERINVVCVNYCRENHPPQPLVHQAACEHRAQPVLSNYRVGEQRRRRAGWRTVVSACTALCIHSQSTQRLSTRDLPLTSTPAKGIKYTNHGETRSS